MKWEPRIVPSEVILKYYHCIPNTFWGFGHILFQFRKGCSTVVKFMMCLQTHQLTNQVSLNRRGALDYNTGEYLNFVLRYVNEGKKVDTLW